jgi:ribosome-associated heat shock protein Hsp15
MVADRSQRVDKWLWFARIVKSRSLAQALVEQGAVRINRTKVMRSSAGITPGDVVTVAVHDRVRVLKVLGEGRRRGPAAEARELYEDLSPGQSMARDVPPRDSC